jgi:hypothetical protein
MDEDHRSTAPGHAGFEATRWSVVLEAARSRAPGGPEALARLCERYWPPLYALGLVDSPERPVRRAST